jgi:hypothetical protein
MPRRSWKTALFLAYLGGSLGLSSVQARASDPVQNTVQLQIQISGLSADGCLLEIRPAHPGCSFAPVALKVQGNSSGQTVRLEAVPFTVTSTGADRDCTFAITVREPNAPPRTIRRGLQLVATDPGQPQPSQTFRVFLATPSLALRDGEGKVTR